MKIILPIFSLLIVSCLSLNLFSQERCGFDEIYRELLKQPAFVASQARLNQLNKTSSKEKTQTVFIIPTVVHVIYKNQSENVSLVQIQSQLDILNEDFRKLNADTSNVEQGFSKADVGIEFCLARRDPNGNVTTGVTKTTTTIDNVCDINSSQYYQLAPIWNPDHYLNIWVCDINNGVAGYAFPPNQIARNRDGLVIQYDNFGSGGSAIAPYDLGRTTTHEIGHWFNLFHPWGNGFNASCSTDDGIADTPNQGVIYNGCPSLPKLSCGTKDMLSNFMGYLDDKCMGNFTEGQKDKIRSTIVNARPSLLLSKGCLPVGLEEIEWANAIQLFPNPVSDKLYIQLKNNVPKIQSIELIDAKGNLMPIETNLSANGYQLMVNSLPNGLYFVRLSSNEAAVIKKLVVAH